jgi:hypothetical protein
LVKVTGCLFAMDTKKNEFVRHDHEPRTRIISLASDMLIINVLPPQVDLSKIVYQHHHSGKELTVTDGSDWRLCLSHL